MKKLSLLLFFSVSFLFCVAQDTTKTKNVQTGKTYSMLEQMPEFPGGEKKMLKFIKRKTNYPLLARESNITGKVILTFVIDENGNVKDAKVLKGLGSGCDEEALRVVNSMPKWTPAKENGKYIPMNFFLPISFHLK